MKLNIFFLNERPLQKVKFVIYKYTSSVQISIETSFIFQSQRSIPDYCKVEHVRKCKSTRWQKRKCNALSSVSSLGILSTNLWKKTISWWVLWMAIPKHNFVNILCTILCTFCIHILWTIFKDIIGLKLLIIKC